jgi:hypothetical protein
MKRTPYSFRRSAEQAPDDTNLTPRLPIVDGSLGSFAATEVLTRSSSATKAEKTLAKVLLDGPDWRDTLQVERIELQEGAANLPTARLIEQRAEVVLAKAQPRKRWAGPDRR